MTCVFLGIQIFDRMGVFRQLKTEAMSVDMPYSDDSSCLKMKFEVDPSQRIKQP